MSELVHSHEGIPPTDPILQLVREMGTPLNDQTEELLQRFNPAMDNAEKAETLSALQQQLQEEAMKTGNIDQFYQVCHQIGIILTTAHAHYKSNGTWPEVAEELDDAYYMADQTAGAGKSVFNIIALKIDNLTRELAGKQYRD